MESMKNIRAFLAVAETQSFTAAADKLFLTQPTITKRISQLESQLNNQLFHRTGSLVQLTTAGKALIPDAHHLIQVWSSLEHKMQLFQDDVIGDLTISCNYHMGLHFLPKILKIFTSKYPKVNIKLDSTYSLPIIEKVSALKAEIGLITMKENMPENIDCHLLQQSRVIAVIAKNHPFWQQNGDIVERLNEIPVLSPAPENRHHTVLHILLDKHKIHSPELSNINMLEIIKRLVESGFGWSIITEDMMSDKLKKLPLIDTPIYINSACIYHKKVELSRAAKAFLEICQKVS
ncbi:LysR family transcriptional regulator [Cysteiniphilum sp. 6C5]|uniref:LysR family transcriptional regulator n=1 Tax=unclassified Cysteiniphilum TaxID=2610889 RepID=UPI003F827546